MKKLILFTVAFLTMTGNGWAYTPFTTADHLQIDRQLNQNLSKAEKKEKSDFFSRLAQKSLAIRKAFSPTKTKLYWAKLSAKDQNDIKSRISAIANLPEEKKKEILEELLKTEQLAEEISRSLQIESRDTFEGYAKTKLPTPVFRLPIDDVDLNNILWGKGTTGMKVNEYNMIEELAVVLPPGTVVSLMKKVQKGDFVYYQIRTREFDAGRGAKFGYFLDARFIEKTAEKPEEKAQTLPSLEDITNKLLATSGSVYVWGGSRYEGIPELEKYFPSATKLSALETKRKLMKGVDCSGLLYQATNGFTPRNSRSLLNFWEPINIEGKKIQEIIPLLKPLDLIVWDGHVVIVLDEKRTIESRGRGKAPWGIEIVPIEARLTELFKTRSPVNNYETSHLPRSKKFVIRRRFSEK